MSLVAKYKSVSPLLPHHHLELLHCLDEAIESAQEGEVIVKCDDHSGRIYTTKKSIAWVIVSTRKYTLSTRLVDQGLLDPDDLREVLQECDRSGANFGETIIDWGLLHQDILRRELRLYIAEAVLEILTWPSLQTMFVPSSRPTYRGTLLFSLDEVLESVIELDIDHKTRLNAYLPFNHSTENQKAPNLLLPSVPNLQSVKESEKTRISAIVPSERKEAVKPVVLSDAILEELATYIQELKRIKGFLAIGVVDSSGRLLKSGSVPFKVKLETAGVEMSKLYNLLATACEDSGLASPYQVFLTGEKGGLLYQTAESGEPSNVHLLSLITADSSYTLIQLTMAKLHARILELLNG